MALAEFTHGNLRILGTSVGGEESCFVLPELNVGFDLGRAPRELLNVEHVFLTHGHYDHSVGAVYYFAQREFIGVTPGTLYAPAPLAEPLRRMLSSWAEIDGHAVPCNVQPLVADVDVYVRKDLLVRPFLVHHVRRRQEPQAPRALGFTVIEVRQKIHEEYRNLSGPQIVELKRQGVEITRRIELPLVTYCGDTTPGPFLDLPFVRESRVLLFECTFVNPDDVERADAGMHTHLRDLRGVLDKLGNERILLTHLSRRTALPDAKAALLKHVGDFGERVSFFMEHRARRRPPRGGDAGAATALAPPP